MAEKRKARNNMKCSMCGRWEEGYDREASYACYPERIGRCHEHGLMTFSEEGCERFKPILEEEKT